MEKLEHKNTGRYMGKIWIVLGLIIVLLMFTGCGIEITYWEDWTSPNWTSDGKIVFLEDTGEQKINSWGNMVGGSQTITLYEIDGDGNNLQQIAEIISCSFESGRVLVPMSTSSAGDWVVLSMEDWRRGDHYPVMYTVKRNGDSLSEIGSGRNSDFSPDASQIVYEKPNQGIWIIDRDGGNDHQIISDTNAQYPAWSPDDALIAYGSWGVKILNLINDSIISEYPRTGFPDWGSGDSIVVISTDGPIIINIESEETDTITNFSSGAGIFWSSDRQKFICYDGSWFVINRNGSNKWYLQP